jgi:sugar-phosphatase
MGVRGHPARKRDMAHSSTTPIRSVPCRTATPEITFTGAARRALRFALDARSAPPYRAAVGRVQERTAVGAVLFDADGVLIDSTVAYRRIWRRWAQRHRLDADLVWSHTHGRRPVDTVTVVAPHLDVDAEYRLLRELMAAEGDAFAVYPDAAAVLRSLHGRWGVVTSGQAPTVLRRLRRGGLPEPPVLVDGSQVSRGKPDPEGYLRAARLLDVSPARCLVVEDAPAGVDAGLAAGMTVVAVRTTHPDDELVRAHHRVDHLHDVMPLIKNQD